MKYYIIDYSLNKEQRKYLESKGFNCYDLRDSCFYGDGATIENRVIVNNCGSIIINDDLHLSNNEFYSLDLLMDNATEYKYEEIQDYLDNCWDLRNKNEDLDL